MRSFVIPLLIAIAATPLAAAKPNIEPDREVVVAKLVKKFAIPPYDWESEADPYKMVYTSERTHPFTAPGFEILMSNAGGAFFDLIINIDGKAKTTQAKAEAKMLAFTGLTKAEACTLYASVSIPAGDGGRFGIGAFSLCPREDE